MRTTTGIKKFLFAVLVMLLPITQLAAQNWLLDLKKAVDQLYTPFNRRITVRIQPITISGTDTPTAFSQYLVTKISNFAVNTPIFTVINDRPATRSVNRPQNMVDTATITGSYMIYGDSLDVTLHLISDADWSIMSSVTFTVPLTELEAAGIAFLPPDAKTVAEVEEKEAVLVDITTDQVMTAQTGPGQAAASTTAPTAASATAPTTAPTTAPIAAAWAGASASSANQKLVLSAWPDPDPGSRVYYDGDELSFSIFADKDCYVMVYHIDTNQKIQLIFPNTHDRDNFIKGGAAIKIPQNGSYFFKLQAPFGQDTILVKGALKQFANIDAEMQEPETDATRETVTRSVRRGLNIQVRPVASTEISTETDSSDESDATVRFTYTVIPSAENRETVSFSKPDNTSLFFRELLANLSALGGQINGSEQQGSFSAPGISGTYYTEGSDIVFTLREQYNAGSAARTRNAGPQKAYSFTFARPRDIRQAISTARINITQKGGIFSGNESAGSFFVSKIVGEYVIADLVTVRIIDKPAIIPNSLIETHVKKFFGLK